MSRPLPLALARDWLEGVDVRTRFYYIEGFERVDDEEETPGGDEILCGEAEWFKQLGNELKRADPDQPNAPSLASAGGCNLDVCACFFGSTWRGDQELSYEVLWTFRR